MDLCVARQGTCILLPAWQRSFWHRTYSPRSSIKPFGPRHSWLAEAAFISAPEAGNVDCQPSGKERKSQNGTTIKPEWWTDRPYCSGEALTCAPRKTSSNQLTASGRSSQIQSSLPKKRKRDSEEAEIQPSSIRVPLVDIDWSWLDPELVQNCQPR